MRNLAKAEPLRETAKEEGLPLEVLPLDVTDPDSITALMARIEVPIILLWFAQRRPAYQVRYGNARSVFGGFPQLVDDRCFDAAAAMSDLSVIHVSSTGSPFPLTRRSDGEPTSVVRPDGVERNEIRYYPSPEMHAEAASRLLVEAGDLLGA